MHNMRVLVLLLLGVTIDTAAGFSYVITAPNTLRAGEDYSVTSQILKANSSVTLTLKVMNREMVLAEKTLSIESGGLEMASLKMPDVIMARTLTLSVLATGGLYFNESRPITVDLKSLSVFVQTDKGIYKPGQTVLYRIFATKSNLVPKNVTAKVVIQDSHGNKVKQLTDVTGGGILKGQFTLSDQPVLGTWKIIVEVQTDKIVKTFVVDKYVLPKFGVTVKLPSFAISGDGTWEGSVDAQYTYGKGVVGRASISIGLEHFPGYAKKINVPVENGKVDFIINGDDLIEQLTNRFTWRMRSPRLSTLDHRTLIVKVNVTDSLSGVTRSGEKTMKLYRNRHKFDFPKYNPTSFKPGLTYSAVAYLKQQDDAAFSVPEGEVHTVEVTITSTFPMSRVTSEPCPLDTGVPCTTAPFHFRSRWNYIPTRSEVENQNITVESDGSIMLNLTTKKGATAVRLELNHINEDSSNLHKQLSKANSPSDNYIQISMGDSQLNVGDLASFSIAATEPLQELSYQVISKGLLATSGDIQINNSTETSLVIPLTSAMAPSSTLVVFYVRVDGEVVNDAVSFNVKGIFNNKAFIKSNSSAGEPGDHLTLQLKAEPGSLFAIAAVDQSVLLLSKGNDVTQKEVVSEILKYSEKRSRSGVDVGFRRMCWGCRGGAIRVEGLDASTVFDNSGMIVLTDATVYRKPRDFYPHFQNVMPGVRAIPQFGGAMFNRRKGGEAFPTTTHIPLQENELNDGDESNEVDGEPKSRSVFPETWLWTEESLNSVGEAEIRTKAPDTITSWFISGFALHPQSGLGVVESPLKYNVFRPFFVSLNLPYSVVRNEEVVVQAIIYNYMMEDLNVLVEMEPTSDLEPVVRGNASTSDSLTQSVIVLAGKGMTVSFPVIARTLGQARIKVTARSPLAADAIEKRLLVEPEGVPDEFTKSFLLDRNGDFSKEIPIEFPADVVPGSERVEVQVVGDVMGTTLNNLDQLLKMPYGCGEQNMLNFAPNIFVCQYLEATDQMTESIRAKANGFMEAGYQRELSYQHKDGSFSAFGESDDSGSMWLTAFVVKSFQQARQFIFIDDKILEKAVRWILERQNVTGQFPEPGRVIHSDMQGKASSSVALTAYVMSALLEMKNLPEDLKSRVHNAVDTAADYVITADADSTYVLSILHYALVLGNHTYTQVRNTLNSRAVQDNGTLHWTQSHISTTTKSKPKSVDVEMSSYNLLAYTYTDDLVDALPIMKWMAQQRNGKGGFVSTQDTVMGLQALTAIAAKSYQSNDTLLVEVQDEDEHHTFDITPDNRLLLQTFVPSTIPRTLRISTRGRGSGLIQVDVNYNVYPEVEEKSFELNVDVERETKKSLLLNSCVRYTKESNSATGMAVMEVGMLSGFVAGEESVSKSPIIKRVEVKGRKLILYMDSIPSHESVCVQVELKHEDLVSKPQPAYVTVYDYYNKDSAVTRSYQSQLYKDMSVCEICKVKLLLQWLLLLTSCPLYWR